MSLYAWGRNTFGQLGLKQEPRPSKGHQQQRPAQGPAQGYLFGRPPSTPENNTNNKPVCVEVDGERFVAAAAGEHHTLVVTQYGDVKAFGRGREGQLGHSEGSRLDTDVPGKVEGLSGVTVVAVACGAFHSLAVTSSGRLYEWGLIHTEPDAVAEEPVSDGELLALTGPSQLQNNPDLHLSRVAADSARRWLTAADAEPGDDYISGDEENEDDGEQVLMQRLMMGRLPTRGRHAVPRLVASLQEMRVTSVSAGYSHSVAVTDQGRAFSSGQNDRGQLGLGHRIHSGSFREVVGMGGRFILEVACGEQHNLARALQSRKSLSNDQQAELYVWGGGRLGQLGLGAASTRLTPTHNPFLSNVGGGVVSVSAGANHSVCAVVSGWVMSWGHAEYNQQGVAVVAGADLMGDGSGHGHGYFRVPRVVSGLVGRHVVSVHCGSNYTLAVDRASVTHSFGCNDGDALGRGWQGTYDPSPGRVSSLPGVVNIAAGARHVAAITIEGHAVGRHLRSIVGDDDSADVALLAPDAAHRGEPGFPVHMCVISARCLYLAGYIKAALEAAEEETRDGKMPQRSSNSGLPKTVTFFLENATADAVGLLVQYLYTDEVPSDVAGQTLLALAGLGQDLLLPRLEMLCVQSLPYSLRRSHLQRSARAARATSSVVEVPRSTFQQELGRLAGRTIHSDVLLVLPAWDWEFHCHKVVLCTSPWWRALMRGGFREGGRDTIDLSGLLQEGITRPEALEAVVRHVYTKSADSVVSMDPSTTMEVVILAEFMVLPALISACQCELARYVDTDSAPYLASFANRYRLLKLESLCQEKLYDKADSPTVIQ